MGMLGEISLKIKVYDAGKFSHLNSLHESVVSW